MCRFLLFKSNTHTEIHDILHKFGKMAEKSRAHDGDRQSDGWGISWNENGKWKSYKSIKPIWKDLNTITSFPKSTVFAIHARSASFPQHKNKIEYNQPYINDTYSYVFNGLLKGVALSLPGEIGAQKIWALIKQCLETMDRKTSVIQAVDTLKNNSRSIQALNIGLAQKDTIGAYSFFTQYPHYYSLYYVDTPSAKLICSEPIDGFHFKTLPNDSFIIL